ncbi:glycoside hydrolase family 125 protein [Streptococcus respiraculi]|uniref:glycoside hydrolase family 125 protein n=1 Tax=Streptococcus respiraculi TaxID=2021971 RepID=UPI000E718704|nr:glycoside hydrolase family 125 protein [Streptococcus respiraculi]
MYSKKLVNKWLQAIAERAKNHPEWVQVFERCYTDTLDNTVKIVDDGTAFVLTGDIPAMWLRDSTAQVKPYLFLAKEDEQLRKTILGVLRRQLRFILHDPYANAFNMEDNWKGHHETDRTDLTGWIWERKYEVDSLCYPLQLAYLLWKVTGETSQFDEEFISATKAIIHLWQVEQDHSQSSYSFVREGERLEDTLVNDGTGPAFGLTGMTWSGFRPSDDACEYSYLVPSNMFAVVVLGYVVEIFEQLNLSDSEDIVSQARVLQGEIKEGIETYGKTQNQAGETIYAFEVDGLGNASIMDDPNVPSLLAAPYLGYCDLDDEVYQATRRTILSKENPYYYEGEYAKGLGSSHTFYRYIWPIALCIEGLTTKDQAEKERILDLLIACDGGTGVMHESFHVDDPTKFSREWFSWANMMFCELVLDYYGMRVEV